jgi:hypothetical protein
VYYGVQGAISVAGPLPFSTITGAWERRRRVGWRIGRHINSWGIAFAYKYKRYNFLTVSLPKWLRNAVMAVSILKPPPESRNGLKHPLELLENPTLDILALQER